MISLKELVTGAYTDGKVHTSYIRKVTSNASTAGMWVDLSMATGTPTANFYLGDERTATVPALWYKKGIWHGGDVSPSKKFLHKLMVLGTTAVLAPCPFLLCDYLMYYPVIDMDSTDVQELINPTTPTIPRYTNGEGVQAFLVATNPYVGGAQFQMTYVNTKDETHVCSVVTTNTAGTIGTLVNSNFTGLGRYGAFIPLAMGDTGIKKVLDIVFLSPNGGLATLVLVRPIATITTRELTAWAEFDYIKDKPSVPRIYDGAYLNLLAVPSGTIANIPLLGEATFIWE